MILSFPVDILSYKLVADSYVSLKIFYVTVKGEPRSFHCEEAKTEEPNAESGGGVLEEGQQPLSTS